MTDWFKTDAEGFADTSSWSRREPKPGIEDPPVWLSFPLVIGAMPAAVAAAAVGFGIRDADRLLWIAVGSSWAIREQTFRWWRRRFGARTAAIWPATSVWLAGLALGMIGAASDLGDVHRARWLCAGLIVAWFVGDLVDFAWCRWREPQRR